MLQPGLCGPLWFCCPEWCRPSRGLWELGKAGGHRQIDSEARGRRVFARKWRWRRWSDHPHALQHFHARYSQLLNKSTAIELREILYGRFLPWLLEKKCFVKTLVWTWNLLIRLFLRWGWFLVCFGWRGSRSRAEGRRWQREGTSTIRTSRKIYWKN